MREERLELIVLPLQILAPFVSTMLDVGLQYGATVYDVSFYFAQCGAEYSPSDRRENNHPVDGQVRRYGRECSLLTPTN